MSRKEKDYTLDDAVLSFDSKNVGIFRQRFTDNEDIMSKSVFTSDFERTNKLPQEVMSIQPKKKVVKMEKLSDEMLQNVQILKMRAALDPKRFYKKDKTMTSSNKLQIGHVVDSPVDFYNSRLPRKQRKSNLVDELLADAEFQQYNKKRFLQVINKKRSLSKKFKHYRQRNKKQTKDSDT